MPIVEFIWDAENTKHLARHKITPHQEHSREDRALCFGSTAKGRLLTIIYTVRGGVIRVVTGYRMTKWQQRMYFEDK